MSIDTRDQIEILKYYSKFLTMQESFYFSVEIQKWKKYNENIPFERGTLEWLRDAPYLWWDWLHTGTWGDLPNETKVVEVNEPGFVLTEFPE